MPRSHLNKVIIPAIAGLTLVFAGQACAGKPQSKRVDRSPSDDILRSCMNKAVAWNAPQYGEQGAKIDFTNPDRYFAYSTRGSSQRSLEASFTPYRENGLVKVTSAYIPDENTLDSPSFFRLYLNRKTLQAVQVFEMNFEPTGLLQAGLRENVESTVRSIRNCSLKR